MFSNVEDMVKTVMETIKALHIRYMVFTHLNCYFIRPVHPFPSTRDILTILLKILELKKEIIITGSSLIVRPVIKADDSKYKAIAKFPTPANVSQLRSFLRLANQLTAFVPD